MKIGVGSRETRPTTGPAPRFAVEAEDFFPREIGELTNLLGTPDPIKKRLRAHCDAGITSLRVGLLGENVDARLENHSSISSASSRRSHR
jgi:hypothetical protein